jgi:hypothetical protein
MAPARFDTLYSTCSIRRSSRAGGSSSLKRQRRRLARQRLLNYLEMCPWVRGSGYGSYSRRVQNQRVHCFRIDEVVDGPMVSGRKFAPNRISRPPTILFILSRVPASSHEVRSRPTSRDRKDSVSTCTDPGSRNGTSAWERRRTSARKPTSSSVCLGGHPKPANEGQLKTGQ